MYNTYTGQERMIVVPKARYRPKHSSKWEELTTANDMEAHEDYDYIYVDKGAPVSTALRRHKEHHQFPVPNPEFEYKYTPSKDGVEFRRNLKLDNSLSTNIKKQDTNIC